MMMKQREEKKAKIRVAYRDFAEKRLAIDLGRMNDKQRTLVLAQFYVEEIYNRTSGYISDEEFESSYVDAGNDLGADLIYKDDGRVLILQVKYAKEGVSAKPEEIEYFQNILSRLVSPAYRRQANRKLTDALADIDLDRDTFDLRFITFGRIDGQAKTQASMEPKLPSQVSVDRVSCVCLDEAELTEELRAALSGDKTRECVLFAHGARGRRSPVVQIEGTAYPSCLMVVSAQQIIDLYKKYRDALFSLNIRNYLGNTKTNKLIADTAAKRPAEFYHLNNGISCLATRLQVIGPNFDSVKAEQLQVINGAQTVKSLVRGSVHGNWKESGKEPLVLVRITEISDGYGAAGRFRDELVRANNTQNIIKASDFRSNDPVQQDLKKKFEGIRRRGKSVEYMPKRTDRSKANSFVVRMEEFAKVIYSFSNDPASFSGSTSFLFDDGESGGYRDVFGDGNEPYDPTMPEEEFRLRSAVWWMAEEFGDRLKRDRQATTDPTERAALERKWWLLFASRLMLERSFGDGYRADLRKLHKGDWEMGKDAEGRWFEELYDKAKKSLIYVYGQAARKDGFVHRNWMRSQVSVADVSTFIRQGLLDPMKAIGKS